MQIGLPIDCLADCSISVGKEMSVKLCSLLSEALLKVKLLV